MGNWTPEQQKEHRKLWVEALRSGEYEQGRGRLRSGSAFCCLGVASDICRLGNWRGSNYSVSNEAGLEVDRSWAYLPAPVIDWLGLRNHYAGYFSNPEGLADLNDKGKSFAVIADIIESEPEGLLSSPEAA